MIFGKPPDHLIKVATLIKDFWKLWGRHQCGCWEHRSYPTQHDDSVRRIRLHIRGRNVLGCEHQLKIFCLTFAPCLQRNLVGNVQKSWWWKGSDRWHKRRGASRPSKPQPRSARAAPPHFEDLPRYENQWAGSAPVTNPSEESAWLRGERSRLRAKTSDDKHNYHRHAHAKNSWRSTLDLKVSPVIMNCHSDSLHEN